MEEGRTGADDRADEKLTLREAAARLGVSESAIRKRVERGTLRSDKGPDGKRYVYLDTRADNMADAGADAYERDALISAKDETISLPRQQLEAERQSSAELRRIVAALTSRIPELPAASSEPPEGPVTTTDKPERDTSARSEEGAQEGAQRPWWRRWFGG